MKESKALTLEELKALKPGTVIYIHDKEVPSWSGEATIKYFAVTHMHANMKDKGIEVIPFATYGEIWEAYPIEVERPITDRDAALDATVKDAVKTFGEYVRDEIMNASITLRKSISENSSKIIPSSNNSHDAKIIERCWGLNKAIDIITNSLEEYLTNDN